MFSRIITTAGAVLMLATLIAPGVRAQSKADLYAKITTPGVRADSAGGINQIDGLALHGFDPVAYFTQNKAVKGEPVLTASYQVVTYQFASKEDQAAFQANPAKYVPQYGGFCALATSIGIKVISTRTPSRSTMASSTSTTATRRCKPTSKTSRATPRRRITIGWRSPSSRRSSVNQSTRSAGAPPL